MQRTAPTADPDADRLVFFVTEPAPEADLYDYPGDYAQRFDGIDAAAVEPEPEAASEVYVNHFECIPDG